MGVGWGENSTGGAVRVSRQGLRLPMRRPPPPPPDRGRGLVPGTAAESFGINHLGHSQWRLRSQTQSTLLTRQRLAHVLDCALATSAGACTP